MKLCELMSRKEALTEFRRLLLDFGSKFDLTWKKKYTIEPFYQEATLHWPFKNNSSVVANYDLTFWASDRSQDPTDPHYMFFIDFEHLKDPRLATGNLTVADMIKDLVRQRFGYVDKVSTDNSKGPRFVVKVAR